MKNLIANFRFIAVNIVMIMIILLILIAYPFVTNKTWYKITRLWAISMIKATGAKLVIYGNTDYKLHNTMVVANHVSWLDTVVLYRILFVNFIGKKELQKWFLLRKVLNAGGTIFIDRSKKREVIDVNNKVAELLKNGACIGFFPEGTTSKGFEILPFKAPLLEAALIADSKIVPIVIRYYKQDGEIAPEVSFSKLNWIEAVMNTFKLQKLVIRVDILDTVVSSTFISRDALAEYLRDQMIKVHSIKS